MIRALFDRFDAPDPGRLTVLAGNVASLAVVRTWDVEGDMLVAFTQPATPLVLSTAGGTFYFYQHRGPISSRFLVVPTFNDNRAHVEIIGDLHGVVVPPTQYHEIENWPSRAELPHVNLDLLLRGLR